MKKTMTQGAWFSQAAIDLPIKEAVLAFCLVIISSIVLSVVLIGLWGFGSFIAGLIESGGMRALVVAWLKAVLSS